MGRDKRARVSQCQPLLGKDEPQYVDVQWDQGIGSATVDHIEKCRARDFVRVGNVVKAAYDLDYADIVIAGDVKGTEVKEGSLGTITSDTETGWLVSWSGRELGPTAVNVDQITKCSALDFIDHGDVVKAAYDLDYAGLVVAGDDKGTTVKTGSLGTIASSTETGWIVKWSGRSLGPTSVTFGQVTKCSSQEYVIEGDVVRATCDLDYSSVGNPGDDQGTEIKQGSLGTIQSQTETDWIVSWYGRSLGTTYARPDTIRKCAWHEFFLAGDTVRARRDLDYPFGVVRRGALGTLKRVL